MSQHSPQSVMSYPGPDEPLLLILKLPGETCNINCHYCFEKRKPYERHEYLEPEALRAFLGTMEGRPLDVHLHGGEPLLAGIPRMSRLLRVVRDYPGKVHLNVQTNGLLLTAEWLDFFDREWPEIEIGISLDGDLSANAYRVDYQERPTFDRVRDALERCEARGRSVGVISVVTRHSLGRGPQLLDFFGGFGAVSLVHFAPCLDYDVKTMPGGPGLGNPTGQGRPAWATTPEEYGDFLIEAYEHWRTSGAYQRLGLEPILSVIKRLRGANTSLCHFTSRKCAHILTLYPDGRVGACDELRMPDAQLAASPTEVSRISEITDLHTRPGLRAGLERLADQCRGCVYRDTCGGGCLATRLAFEGTSHGEGYCRMRGAIVDHVAASIGVEPPGVSGAHV